MTDLFQAGDFTLASGESSAFKIECDALSDDEITVLARLLWERIPHPFRSVWGVPTGGLRLAEALVPYCREDADIVLLVDDVWTTGGSMYRFSSSLTHDPGPQHGAVLFARAQTPLWVTALFTMPALRTKPA